MPVVNSCLMVYPVLTCTIESSSIQDRGFLGTPFVRILMSMKIAMGFENIVIHASNEKLQYKYIFPTYSKAIFFIT